MFEEGENMKHVLSDGRTLFMKKEEIEQFFEEHELKGKRIADIRPSELDYIIANLAYLEDDTFDYYGLQTDEGIGTDGKICFFFDDQTSVEVEISGSGPVILGYGTADPAEYEHVWGSCYKLTTVFKDVAGRTIKDVKVEKTEESMWFPSYYGMDLSDENEGAYSIEFILDDNTMMKMYGAIDYFNIDHCDLSGEELYGITIGELLSDLNAGQLNSMFSESSDEQLSKDRFNRYGVSVFSIKDNCGIVHNILVGVDGEQIPGTEGMEFSSVYDYNDRFLEFDKDLEKRDSMACGIYDTRNRCVLRNPK